MIADKRQLSRLNDSVWGEMRPDEPIMSMRKPSDPAYTKFKELLFSRTLRPGQFVTQKELLDHLGMSLGPVRTALARLEADGFIQILPHRGIQIVEPSLALFRNVTQVRIALEKEAWGRFALTADDETLSRIERFHIEAMEKANGKITPDLLREVSDFDRWMHDAAVEAMNNTLFFHLYRINLERLLLIRPDQGHISAHTIGTTMQEHLAMVRGCIARDPAAAAKAVETHLMSAVHRFMNM